MKRELRITVNVDLKKRVNHIAVDEEVGVNKVCEKLMLYALDHLDNIDFQE